VVNRTRVRAARLLGSKSETGGRVEALLLRPLTDNVWQAAVRPARRLRPGSELDFGPIKATIAVGPVGGIAELRLSTRGDLESAIDQVGQVPLPPYIHTGLPDPERYQTIYAREVGSAAAPTAGLHFTADVLADLSARSIGLADIELRIGLDTFKPISSASIEDHQIHAEEFSVPAATADRIGQCHEAGGRVVAIGTTVVRALESRATGEGQVDPGDGITGLYITPGFSFRVVDLLVTNFHLPRTTLLVLLASFMGRSWRRAYDTALRRGYRFASFGDAMLTERSR
ncbi:MAG TPA: S-adenosylmethionine:tRNA ribosyltransferase-isomerase, partial [Acidimicrobiia bacterium]|nr:S-adenosylmethionine:tRNA ribosyltransferase-isomerase [Acidimicrobiia bacterium]